MKDGAITVHVRLDAKTFRRFSRFDMLRLRRRWVRPTVFAAILIAFAVMALWRYLFFLPAFFAVMFGLIMRVLKNVFEQAVEIKSENDFTI